jgi:hypothetical protein
VGTSFHNVTEGQRISSPEIVLTESYSMLRFTPLARRTLDPLLADGGNGDKFFNLAGFILYRAI